MTCWLLIMNFSWFRRIRFEREARMPLGVVQYVSRAMRRLDILR